MLSSRQNIENTLDPRERILNAAASLFADFGYASVGVREIARLADVNISMISYYFQGKTGLLKEIIKGFFDDLKDITLEIKEMNLPHDKVLPQMIRSIVNLLKDKPDHCKVAFMEMSIKPNELNEYKSDLLLRHLNIISETFHGYKIPVEDKEMVMIVGPAFFSMVYSHFIFNGILKSAYNMNYDEEFTNRYSEVISTLFINGVKGLKEHPGSKHDETDNEPEKFNEK